MRKIRQKQNSKDHGDRYQNRFSLKVINISKNPFSPSRAKGIMGLSELMM
jgi:hypothetical protein